MKLGKKSFVIKSIKAANTLSAQSLVKHLKGGEAADLHIIGAKPSEAPEGRLRRRLKDALRAHATAATWSEELPFVLLRLRAQPREDTGLSPAEAVFGAQIVLPN